MYYIYNHIIHTINAMPKSDYLITHSSNFLKNNRHMCCSISHSVKYCNTFDQ